MKGESLSSSQPDLTILSRLHAGQHAAVAIIAVVTALVCLAWIAPGLIGALLPDGWSLMKFNTGLGLLLAAASFSFSQERRSAQQLKLSLLFAGMALLLGLSALLVHVFDSGLGLETLFVADMAASRPGLMSLQSSAFLFLLSLTLLFNRSRKSLMSKVSDVLAMALIITSLIIFSGYCFGAAGLYGQSADTVTSPHTLVCMLLLTFLVVSRRAEYGVFSVIVGVGIGSRISRMAAPIALLLPFAMSYGFKISASAGWVSNAYAAAMSTAFIALLFFWMVIMMAWRINDLERDLRDMSLTDELTGLYNRRGFYLLGEQALRDARRMDGDLSVLFFDLDNLKTTNDTLGHEIGNQLLSDMAGLLSKTFRSSDLVGRIGGDEYVVAVPSDPAACKELISRLSENCQVLNASGERQYTLSYSVGMASWSEGTFSHFQQLVKRADELMYEQKQQKKRRRSEARGEGDTVLNS